MFLSFFLKQHITERSFASSSIITESFVKKRNEALVVLKGTEETFERRLRERSRQRKAFIREYIRIYNSTIISSRIQVKDERGGPETVGSDDQGKSPRLLLLLFFNVETSLFLSRFFIVVSLFFRERVSSSADLLLSSFFFISLFSSCYYALTITNRLVSTWTAICPTR